VILGGALRHAIALLSAREDIGAGRSIDDAWRSFRLHFRRETAVKQQLQRWTTLALRRAIARLQSAVLESRRRAEVAEAVAAQALFEIATAARAVR
jgi:DNA polymerase III subunit delta